MVNFIAGLIAYLFQLKKPSLKITQFEKSLHIIDLRLNK
ncbi:hypothetical protein BTN49_3300 [Candidatus Enterovibrio escicola]|uniref:Uncharacterized protein n=1 Tax=Candidatus Enterovibrio escicola TaxID=1927127 RepID=A0A2A5SZ04_9GAMM|nr:hypothetical protein BTN49_3300 [Candidatus Enterovibrio escacola]